MVALVFLILGFQLAVFVMKVVDRPPAAGNAVTSAPSADSVPVPFSPEVTQDSEPLSPRRTKYGGYPRPGKSAGAPRPAALASRRSFESFPFDPNTVSPEDLRRLGLTERQAQSIVNYREKGGRFRVKSDFRKMYVVSDSLFARLESYIDIPKLELNSADSASLVSLRGIGPWYARKILDYRERLGGFVKKEQLLEIEGMDRERFDGFVDELTVDPAKVRKLDIWNAPESLLVRHPYLGPRGARSIVRYRELYDSTRRSLHNLSEERALSEEIIEKLKNYIETR